jgi:hypothetical protein
VSTVFELHQRTKIAPRRGQNNLATGRISPLLRRRQKKNDFETKPALPSCWHHGRAERAALRPEQLATEQPKLLQHAIEDEHQTDVLQIMHQKPVIDAANK